MNKAIRSVQLKDYSEGYVSVLGHWIFFKSFGIPKKGTVLCLHGGPGGTHNNLIAMTGLSDSGYRVVLYDQLGCGLSDSPSNQRLYSVERYVEEVEGVRRGLHLGRVHLYGHSWGGFLNLAYAIKYPANLESLLVSSGSPSGPLCASELERLRAQLPVDLQERLTRYEDDGDYSNDEYLNAMDEVYRKHVCRLDPWPPDFRSMADRKRRGLPRLAYKLMWGPNEFVFVGTLRYWDITSQLRLISTPTLITCGKYDEVTPKNGEVLSQGIKDSKFTIFQKSSHCAYLEEPEKYLEVYKKFVDGLS